MTNSLFSILFTCLFMASSVFAQESVRPWIGIHIEKHEKGVFVKKAVDGTPGFRAGLSSGDIIIQIDKTKVATPSELIAVVQNKGVGNKVTITYLKDGGKQTKTSLELEAMPGLTEVAEKRLLNNKAPQFKGKILSHDKIKEYDLSKDKKVKLIEFWATWCPACIQAHPFMDQFAAENKDSITVLSLSSEDSIKVKKYLKKAKQHKLSSGAVLFLNDPTEKINGDYLVPALPMFLVIDQQNTVKFLTVGVGKKMFEAFNLAKKLAKNSK